MKRLALTVALLAGIALPSWAGFEAGLEAYNRGDYAIALHEFKRLAERGNGVAQYNLGFMYANGHGVPRDDVAAHMWANLAATHTGELHENAVELRKRITLLMTPVQIAEAQRLAREWKPNK